MARHPVEELLPRFSLGRPVAVLVLLASIVVVGLVSTMSIPLELVPSGFSNPFLMVRVPWRDAPPREVLDKIVIPLEDQLSTVRGLDTMSSMATSGFARVFLNFKPGTDMDVAYREVRDRIQRARPGLPPDADRIYIRKEDEASIPVYVLGLAIDPGVTDPWNLVQNEVMLRLERIDGVASVDARGLQEKEILIELDRARTDAAGLNIYTVAQQLRRDNFTMSSGEVYWGGSKLLLRSMARYTNLDELRNRIIAPNVRLSDIATISYKEPDQRWVVRVNSKPAVALNILKEGQANALAVCDRINAEVAKMQSNPSLQLIEMAPLFDQGKVIRESLDTLLQSGKIGALFAIGILFFFLRRVRLTLIITLSIPLSILIAITVMYFAGETLNVLSLLGLMISVGLLVDNAVVVAENIHRLHTEGLPRRRAAIQGAAEIALAVTMATLTTIIVFLPVSLVKGQAQFFLLRLSIPISVSLLGSLAVAGIVVPLGVYLTLGGGGRGAGKPWPPWERFTAAVGWLYEQSFERLNRAYNRILRVFLAHRLDLVVLLALVLAATAGVAFHKVKIVETQEEERSGFDLSVRLPQATTLDEAKVFFRGLEKILEAHKADLDLSGYFVFHVATHGRIQGWFNNPRTKPKLTPRMATERLLELLPKKPGVRYLTGQQSERRSQAKRSQYTVTLYGQDPDRLEDAAKGVEELLVKVPGVLGLQSSGDPAPNELELLVNRQRVQELGVNPSVIAGLVGFSLRGQQLRYYRTAEREIPVRLRFREADRETLAQLRSFLVPAADGSFVGLDTLTSIRFGQGARYIRRQDKRIARNITLELEEGREREARKNLQRVVSRLQLPEGITANAPPPGAGNEDIDALKFAGLLSVAFVYLLMGFLFESFILPLSVILTIPLAFIGVGWIHYIYGLDIDFLGVVGGVLLIGVVVNNGIVLIDAVNQLRHEGMERSRAILTAAKRRFRPIMMTALTTIFGLIPVTFAGTSSIGLSYTSFGLTLIGGLTTATLLTLLVVPIFYTLFDDARQAAAATVHRALHGAKVAGPGRSHPHTGPLE